MRLEAAGPPPRKRREIVAELAALGVRPGDVLMVHASLKAVGPVEGGAAALVEALQASVGPEGTLMAFASWDRSPYEATLNGAALSDAERAAWPAFDPASAAPYPGFGLLNRYLCAADGAVRSPHPDASMVAVGAQARYLAVPHALGHAYGPGSPIDRFLKLGGRVLLLGAPLDSVTVIHYAEAVARIPGKRRVSYEMPMLDADGARMWRRAEDFDSNGILDAFAQPNEMDAVETIARLYASEGRAREGRVGEAHCFLIEAGDIVRYAVRWLERLFGGAPPADAQRI